MTEHRYIINRPEFGQTPPFVLYRVEGVVRPQTVALPSRPYILGCVARMDRDKWNRLPRNPDEAHVRYMDELKSKLKHAQYLVESGSAAVTEFEKVKLENLKIMDAR